jgi:hypothetical protein
MDPRIRIHPKMSWIRNTDFESLCFRRNLMKRGGFIFASFIWNWNFASEYADSTLFSGSPDKRFCFYRQRTLAWLLRRSTRWFPAVSNLSRPRASLSASSRGTRTFATTVPYSSATPPICPRAASGNRSGPSFVCWLDLYLRYRICKLS